MKRSISLIAGAAVLVAGTAIVTSRVVYADPPKDKAGGPPGQPEMTEKQKAAMKAMMDYRTPGQHQKHLDAFAGDWNVTSRFWETADGEPEESTGTSTFKWMFDGRFLIQEFAGEAMGMPFKGHGIMAYDNMLKKYQSIWFDTWSTGVMYMTGTCDNAGKVFTLQGETPNPCLGKVVTTRMKQTVVDSSKHIMEMWMPDENGKQFKCMEITYTRK